MEEEGEEPIAGTKEQFHHQTSCEIYHPRHEITTLLCRPILSIPKIIVTPSPVTLETEVKITVRHT